MKHYLEHKQQEYLIIEKKTQQHIFSHFCLNYTAYIVKSDFPKASINNSLYKVRDNEKKRYFSIEKALQLGLSTPIKNLLQTL